MAEVTRVELIHQTRHEAAAACRHTTPPAAPCDACQRVADRFEDVLVRSLADMRRIDVGGDLALSTALLNVGLFSEDVDKACAAVRAEGLIVVGRDDLRELLDWPQGDYGGCAYLARFGGVEGHDPDAVCSYGGCVDEPACVTDVPLGGWPSIRLREALNDA